MRASKLVQVGEVKQQPQPNDGVGAEKRGTDPGVAGPSSSVPAVVEQAGAEVTEVLAGAAPSEPPGPMPAPARLELEPGMAVGRYELVELIGSGGMGSVHRAHDPHLSRDVALKVLHPSHAGLRAGSDYRQRLLREAQALAKLSHPNVVAAFDVGTYQDVVFVAMELVQGESLRTWLHSRRGVPELLRVLVAAGRGLVAAHTAGVLHRDFKPANVMVSPDGRVRVVDFGLASSALGGDEPEELEPAPVAARERGTSLLAGELTESGMLMGTPGYIAPERLIGEPADMLADQFSFAVTAFVTLTGGSLPPAARDQPLPWPREVPRRVRRVVERGLEPDASDRYASVAAMVDALERAGSPRRRTGAVVALGLASAGLLAGGALWLQTRAPRVTCQVDEGQFGRVWDAERSQALQAAFVATRRPNAEEAFGLFGARLDAYRAAWLAMKHEACEATHVRGEQSEKVLGLRNACLDAKLAGAAALVDAFSRPDAGAIDLAAGAVPDALDECADTAALLGMAEKWPPSAEARATIARLDSGLAVTRSLALAGQWQEARSSSEALLAEARTLGHEPTIARALRMAAFAIYSQARNVDDRRQAERYLREAIPLAARSGDDRLVARTASYLFNILAYAEHRTQEAEAMLPHVEALVIRGGNQPADRLELALGQARMLEQRRKVPEAIALFERVIELGDGMGGEWRADAANARGAIGDIYLQLENYPEAVRAMQAALTSLEDIFGGHHPRILSALANLALAQSKVDSDAAKASVAKMRELAVTLPGDDWRTITIPFLDGQIDEDRGDCAHALPSYRSALSLFSRTYGAGSTREADVYARIGACLKATGQLPEALLELEHVLTIRREKGDTPNNVARAAYELAQALASRGKAADRARAVALGQEARSLWQQDGVADKAREAEQWLASAGGASSALHAQR
ncbi:MAG TPA: serine/threonine-protein kinase [Polyangiaceae bacterium]|nr:serine/threonine-protein kinase [Polyangiaceae bacterium]